MFVTKRKETKRDSAFAIAELIYHATVRNLRMGHRSAVIGLVLTIVQSLMLVAMFFVLMTFLGLRSAAVRGDFLLYIMSGVFLFRTHTQSVKAVSGSAGPASAMMLHAPMTTAISIASSALATLYQQFFAACIILLVYHSVFTPISIEHPTGAMAMLLLSWFSGCAVGMVLLALKPWFPRFVTIVTNLYRRANMIFSGKMFLANTLPASMLPMFEWNPLFHAIDQARGFVFLNYTPRVTSIEYPIYLSLALLMIGLMGEFYARKHASVSWAARQ